MTGGQLVRREKGLETCLIDYTTWLKWYRGRHTLRIRGRGLETRKVVEMEGWDGWIVSTRVCALVRMLYLSLCARYVSSGLVLQAPAQTVSVRCFYPLR